MRKYYWIPPTDHTLNAAEHYQASVKGNTVFDFKRNKIVFELSQYFPVGSIFHFMHNEVDYVITCRLRKPGLIYEAKRFDGKDINSEDIDRFNSGRFVYRDGMSL